MPIPDPVRIAILGCGAVTELAHLPAAAQLPGVAVTLLVDTNAARREALGRIFSVPRTAADFRDAVDTFDAAIIALPHALHAPIGLALLEAGKAVLVEKPMANTRAECDALVAAAQRSGSLLAVGLMRRFLWSHVMVHRMIAAGELGRILDFTVEEGSVYNWPVASGFFFNKAAAGGGVLIDTGAHTLDCILHWLGPWETLEYFDDAVGGVEANCLLRLGLAGGVTGTIELSRTRQLRNSARIRGERGTLEVSMGANYAWFEPAVGGARLGGPVTPPERPDSTQEYNDLMREQLADFAAAVRERRAPRVDGQAATASVVLIEECYRRKQPLVFPWEQPTT